MYENRTRFDGKVLKIFKNVYHRQIKRLTLSVFLLMTIAAALMYAVNLHVIGYILIGFGLLVPLFLHVILPIIILRKTKHDTNAKDLLQDEMEQTYIFDEGDIKVSTHTKNGESSHGIIHYETIDRILKLKHHLVFLTVKNEGYVLDAKGMTKGTIIDVYELLKKVVEENKASASK